MNRATCFALLLALACLPAAADDEKFRAALRDGVVKEIQERKEAEANKPQDQELHVAADVGDRKRRHLHGVWWGGSDDSLSVANCPIGSPGGPTFDEVRNYYRDYSDDEMWKICVNRNSYQGAVSGACACSLLAYPDPWRPVVGPHALEREQEPPIEEVEVVIDTVPEEPAQTPAPPPPSIRR